MGNIIAALIQNALVPELLRAVNEHFAGSGLPPMTEADLDAKLKADADGVAARMTAFLASKGQS